MHRSALVRPHRCRTSQATASRTDTELVAELLRHGGPLSGRQVMRLLGVGTPKATRLIRLAGWAPPEPETRPSDHASHPARPLQIVTEPRLRHSQSDDSDDEDHDATSTTSGSAP